MEYEKVESFKEASSLNPFVDLQNEFQKKCSTKPTKKIRHLEE